jgi:hypothetical protein
MRYVIDLITPSAILIQSVFWNESDKILPQIPANKKNKKESYQEELEERIISIIASLFGKQASLFQCYFI